MNIVFDTQTVVDEAVAARSSPIYADDVTVKSAKSRTNHNYDEPGLYPSVIDGGV
jgi:hypothetical protein